MRARVYDNGKCMTVAPRGELKTIHKSKLVVHTFSFPVGFAHHSGEYAFRIDTAFDDNLLAKVRLKAVE